MTGVKAQWRKIKKLFHLDSTELFNFRVYCLLATLFLPIYGYILQFLLPDSIDYISHRVIVSLYWASILCYSFYAKEKLQYFVILFFIGNLLMVTWIGWIVYLNKFSAEYSIGLFMMFCCCSIISRSRVEMTAYTIHFFILIGICFLTLDKIIVSPIVYFLSIGIIVVIYFVVMTWRERAVDTLQQLNEELSFKNDELERFVYAVSHDLKSPLRTIGSFSSLLQRRVKSGDTESIEEYSQFIVNGVNRMTIVIEDILDYSRYGNAKIQFEDVALKSIIHEVKKDIIADEERNRVIIDLSMNLPEKIVGNTTQIKQIFQNLIENAIKYNLSSIKKIWINYKDSNQFHRFEIADNGIGIAPQYKEKIFELFQRLHHTDEFKGTGIGLAICKRIIENHQGNIEVLERAGGGTVFSFKIKKQLT